MNTRQLVVTANGQAFVEERTLLPVSGVPTMLRSLTNNLAIRLPPLTPDTYLVYASGEFTLFRIITKLMMHTTWSLEEGESEPYIYPSFGRERDKMSLETSTYAWIPPVDMALFFVATHLQEGGKLLDPNETGYEYRLEPARIDGKMGLLAMDLNNGILHRLPLPNTYENGTLCQGDLNAMAAGPLTKGQGLFGTWQENRWNSDLIENAGDGYKKLVRLHPETGLTLAPEGGNWRTHCPKVSPGAWLPEKIQEVGFEGFAKK
jgi:hypothetical protein